MTKTKKQHTPGPVKIFKSEQPFPNGGYGVGRDNSLTQIYYFETKEEALLKWAELEEVDVTKLDIRLIAAAPQLLEAAIHFRDCEARKNGWIDCPDCEASEAAIAKSTSSNE